MGQGFGEIPQGPSAPPRGIGAQFQTRNGSCILHGRPGLFVCRSALRVLRSPLAA